MKNDIQAPWAEPVPGAPYPMSADELACLAEDAWQYELVEGRLVRMSPTSDEHFYITDNLHPVLRAYVKSQRLGIVTYPNNGFVVANADGTETVFSPDIAFIRADRVPPLRKKYLAVAPDLAIEIASPSQYHRELADKARFYMRLGVRLVWIIWPVSREIDVWRPGADEPTRTLTSADTLDGLDVVPGFSMPVAAVFA